MLTVLRFGSTNHRNPLREIAKTQAIRITVEDSIFSPFEMVNSLPLGAKAVNRPGG